MAKNTLKSILLNLKKKQMVNSMKLITIDVIIYEFLKSPPKFINFINILKNLSTF